MEIKLRLEICNFNRYKTIYEHLIILVMTAVLHLNVYQIISFESQNSEVG